MNANYKFQEFANIKPTPLTSIEWMPMNDINYTKYNDISLMKFVPFLLGWIFGFLLGLYLYLIVKIYFLNKNISNYITENFIILTMISVISYLNYLSNKKMKIILNTKYETIAPEISCCEDIKNHINTIKNSKMSYAFIDELNDNKMLDHNINAFDILNDNNNNDKIENNDEKIDIDKMFNNYIKNTSPKNICCYFVLFVGMCYVMIYSYKIYVSNLAIKICKFYSNICFALITCFGLLLLKILNYIK